MIRHPHLVLLGWILALLAGCGMSQRPIPPSAQQVHVTVTPEDVRLIPATVRAGLVYVVLDTPNTSYTFVSTGSGEDGEAPLSDDDLARLATGDTQGYSFSTFGAEDCTAEQVAEGRGMMGPPCGNAIEMNLAPGSSHS
jgi:hypothetical protein